ncbi:MAG: methyltransferase domain-containing protein [Candidatus Hydrogenedentes bacterium]|nr:methyltransferase domain-containing protein [Candidatus Hydrogenedentota bacterium]
MKHRILTSCLIAAIAGLALAAQAQEPTAHWRFNQSSLNANQIVDTAGKNPVTVEGALSFGGTAAEEAMLVDLNNTKLALPEKVAEAGLPVDALTVEAWVAIERTVEWGQILSAAKIAGGLEKGWLLGTRQGNFSFGLASEGADDGDGKIAYARDHHTLEWGRWYHVAGTYDGATMRLYVNGMLADESTEQSGKILYGRSVDHQFGGGTDGGWRGWLYESAVFDRALPAEEIQARYAAKKDLFPEALRVALGPWVNRISKDAIRIGWETETPSPSRLLFSEGVALDREFGSAELGTRHEVEVTGLKPETLYNYRIAFNDAQGKTQLTRLHEFDSNFDYTAPQVDAKPYAYANEAEAERFGALATRILSESGIRKGYALIVGSGEGRLAYELAWRSELQVICIDDDPQRAQRVRRKLDDANVYGVRAQVHVAPLDQLPYSAIVANLILSEDLLTGARVPGKTEELLRVLRPYGGQISLGALPDFNETATPVPAAEFQAWLSAGPAMDWKTLPGNGTWATYTRPALAGAGEWTHQYGNATNNTNSGDTIAGGEMAAQWFGEPGPRPMVDRGTRAPAPLTANGRLYVQGDRRLFGMDAYNGTILWTLEIPDLRRANIPRDSSNMVVNGDDLYVAVRERCWVLDGQTGALKTTWLLPDQQDPDAMDWGYMASVGDQVFGSAVRQGGLFIGADGEWYDEAGEQSEKVVSAQLFALDRATGEKQWTYEGGAVINSSITVGGDRLYFVESRGTDALQQEKGRLGGELAQDRFLVAVDKNTGEKIWERPYNVSNATYVLYLMYQDDRIIALNSSDKWDMYAFGTGDGELLWEQHYSWLRDHHGGAMTHPAIIGGKIYAEPKIIDFKTGQVLADSPKRDHGCGTIAASDRVILFRDGEHGMWDYTEDTRARWNDFRPGCWLGMLPAAGLVLAPETSAGCWCAGQPMQSSVAFAPKAK